jgi:hypothetical protein
MGEAHFNALYGAAAGAGLLLAVVLIWWVFIRQKPYRPPAKVYASGIANVIGSVKGHVTLRLEETDTPVYANAGYIADKFEIVLRWGDKVLVEYGESRDCPGQLDVIKIIQLYY